MDQMPHLVSRCIESWVEKNPDWEVRVIDKVNVLNYVSLPDLTVKKITAASLSDILRVSLLHEYGGVWVDATLYCNRPLDEWLMNHFSEGFFAFSKPHGNIMVASWFLAAEEHNLIIEDWYAAVIEFWAQNNSAKAYFWFHHLFRQIYESIPEVANKWNKVNHISADGPHSLQLKAGMFGNNSQLVDTNAPVYKLNYRFDAKLYRPGTLIWQLLENSNRRKKYFSGKKHLIFRAFNRVKRELVNLLRKGNQKRFLMLKTATENLGDHIQIIAAGNLLKPLGIIPKTFVDRDDDIGSAKVIKGRWGKFPILLNGWFKTNRSEWPPHPKLRPLYFSFHIRLFQCPELLSESAIMHYKKWGPVGCRDKFTLDLLQEKQVESFVSHCATMSLLKRKKNSLTQNKVIVISRDKRILDYLPESLGEVEFISHYSGSHNFEENMKSAKQLLDFYQQRASLIITTLLHAANPAMAMGIPLVMFYPINNKAGHKSDLERFSSLADLIKIYHVHEIEKVDWSGTVLNLGSLKLRQKDIFYKMSARWKLPLRKPVGPIAPGSILPPE
jgi:hypothetical protein